ncbi:MAG: type II toxin-antitoxin system VapC family toxin [Cypionkella sp.]
MIAVDTSALMAVLLGEPQAEACIVALEQSGDLLISTGTLAEALIVAARRNLGAEMTRLIEGLGFEIVSVSAAAARRIAASYTRWGKGIDPAGLNFGDRFAYEVAQEHDCPLLFDSRNFARTDVRSALSVV